MKIIQWNLCDSVDIFKVHPCNQQDDKQSDQRTPAGSEYMVTSGEYMKANFR